MALKGVVRDITEQKMMEQRLRRRLCIEEIVAEVSSYIVSTENPDLNRVLQLTARSIDANRAAIYDCDFDQKVCIPIAQWNDPVTEENQEFVELNTEQHSWWTRQIELGKNIDLPDVRQLPTDARTEQQIFVRRGIKSVLAIPIVTTTGQSLGFIEYDDTDCTRAWNGEDIISLKVIAEIIGSHIIRERTQKSLKESERNFRQIFENMQEGFFRIDPEGTLRLANQKLAEILGYDSTEKLTGNSFLELPIAESTDREKFLTNLKNIGIITNLQNTMINKRNRRVHYRVNAQAVHSESGAVRVYDGTVEDITEEKELEEQLIHSQKMEALGRLAGGIAHDFNNLLTVIDGYSSFMLQKIGSDDPLTKDIKMICQAGEQAKTLVSQLLAFSRKQTIEWRVIDINQLIIDTEKMFSRIMGENIQLETDIHVGTSHVEADPGQLEQVIMNMVVNAMDAMPGGGELRIETSTERLESGVNNPDLKPGDYVCISVSDTGIGMDEETQKKIFDPFFTTKEHGEGTGLGLSTVFGVVEQLDGDITVESRLNGGNHVQDLSAGNSKG